VLHLFIVEGHTADFIEIAYEYLREYGWGPDLSSLTGTRPDDEHDPSWG
jgi:hypothetical protein